MDTPLRVLTPMGAYTEPGNPDVIYITDSPGTTSQFIRYTISRNTCLTWCRAARLETTARTAAPARATA